MKKIELITRPDKLEDVKELLNEQGVNGMTVTMVSGCGAQKGKREMYRGTAYDVNLLPKVKIECVVKDEMVEPLGAVIVERIRTGKIGDGKMFVYDVVDALKVRTGEHGDDAI